MNGYIDGTWRWQAPELLSGQSRLTAAMDVYAFAICCIEILSMGRMPWPLLDDEVVRHLVLSASLLPLTLFFSFSYLTCPFPAKDDRPTPHYHDSCFANPGLQELLRFCWHRDQTLRPPFSKIVRDISQLHLAAAEVQARNCCSALGPSSQGPSPFGNVAPDAGIRDNTLCQRMLFSRLKRGESISLNG